LMTCFICVLASRTLWVITGSIVLASRSAEVRV
jgi:hypothetical protein